MGRVLLLGLMAALGCDHRSVDRLDGGPASSPDGGRLDAVDDASVAPDGQRPTSSDGGEVHAADDASTAGDAAIDGSAPDCGARFASGRCRGDELGGWCGSTPLRIDCRLRGQVCHEDSIDRWAACVVPASQPPCTVASECGTWDSDRCEGTTLETLGWHCREGGCVMQRTSAECTATPGGVCLDADRLQDVTGPRCDVLGCGLAGPITHCGDGCDASAGACMDGPALDWTASEVDPTGSTNPVCGLWGRSETEVYAAVCAVGPYRFDGATWTDAEWPRALAIDGDATRTCFAGRRNVYCVGAGTSVRVNLPPTSVEEWIDVSVNGAVVFTAGYRGARDGLLARFNADGTVDEYTDARWNRMNAIVARSPTDVWAAGRNDQIAHFDGTSWTTLTTGRRDSWGNAIDWEDIWLSGTDTVVLVGESGSVVRRTGTGGAWTDVATGVGSDLNAVWGLSSGELIAVGDNGTVLRIGATVTRIDAGFTSDAHAVWASPTGDIWIGAEFYEVIRGR